MLTRQIGSSRFHSPKQMNIKFPRAGDIAQQQGSCAANVRAWGRGSIPNAAEKKLQQLTFCCLNSSLAVCVGLFEDMLIHLRDCHKQHYRLAKFDLGCHLERMSLMLLVCFQDSLSHFCHFLGKLQQSLSSHLWAHPDFQFIIYGRCNRHCLFSW